MITIFKEKKDIPQDLEYVELNDVFFNQHTASVLDEQADQIIETIDHSKRIGQYQICSRFQGTVLDIDRLSTGCKTVLNVFYNPDKVFCMKECGENALAVLYGLKQGYVYSDYAMIPFEMEEVMVQTKQGSQMMENYEKLKEWWNDEK